MVLPTTEIIEPLNKDIEVADLSVRGYSKIEWRDVDEVIGKTDQDNKLFEGSVSNIKKARELLQGFHDGMESM